ncbi:MAG TPA: hypothetical protein DDW95_01585 [Alphaproteobacteria bacterium]|nr:hypothetical protein [Alphaproteobacteria bacterium]
MTKKLVIFDCDGVLVDSEPIANALLCDAINALGYPITIAQTKAQFVGRSMSDVMQLITQLTGATLPAGWLDQLQAQTYAAFEKQLAPVAHIACILEQLIENRHPICVASSGSPEKIALSLRCTNLAAFFGDAVFSASMVARGKPHPDLFLHAAREMGARPADCIVVEDSLPGVTAARAAGMTVFAYAADPDADGDALHAAGGRLFHDMRELPKLIA